MITRLAHVCIHTDSLDRTAAFYCDALGMDVHFGFEKDGKPFGYYLNAGNGTFIEVFKGEPGALGNVQHLALEVEDIDAAIMRIRDHGFEVGDKSLGADDSWQAWMEDPNGVKIELQQYTPKSCQVIRRKCMVNW